MKNIIRPCIFIILTFLIFSCEKENNFIPLLNPWISYGSLTDQDGNTYKTIVIGSQTWMAENLKTTRFNDGASIPLVFDAMFRHRAVAGRIMIRHVKSLMVFFITGIR
jgi:hypothetical protein